MSHELRTPLNAIIGFSGIILMDPAANEQHREYVKDINDSGLHLLAIINDILDLSKVEAGRMTLVEEVVDLRETARSVAQLIAPRADQAELTIADTGDAALPLLWGDAQKVKQILLNLVSNAIKFTPSGGKVSVALDARDEAMEIVVSDTGIGIRPEFLPHLFERFKQGDIPARSGQRGLGLGLAIVKHLAHAHGGSVTAASDGEGHGSTFTLTLPREHASG
jgi:two-component system, cell cycle sensor histidine kinase PleC